MGQADAFYGASLCSMLNLLKTLENNDRLS